MKTADWLICQKKGKKCHIQPIGGTFRKDDMNKNELLLCSVVVVVVLLDIASVWFESSHDPDFFSLPCLFTQASLVFMMYFPLWLVSSLILAFKIECVYYEKVL